MLDNYLKQLDDFILAADEIVEFEIVRRTVWDTDFEKIGIYRYRLHLSDDSLLELTERLVEETGNLVRTKYRYHWQSREGALIKRWDNAKHHPGIDTFPNHIHIGTDENVSSHLEVSGLEILRMVIDEVNKT
jgi:hypothetical protein